MSKISFHIVIDDIPNGDLDKLLNFLIQYNPEYVNIKGGERFDKAMQFVERMFIHCPQIKVILRKWPDDGILHYYNYHIPTWYESTIKPFENWLLQHSNVIWMLDNESMSDDLTKYAIATSEAMELLGSKGIGLAVGRFATGNPKIEQYAQLKPMWEGLKKWFGLHLWSPNEYFDLPNSVSGIGSVFRYHEAWEWCKINLQFIPETVIGEFGLAVNYDPHKGYKRIGMDETHYAYLCNEYFRKWYAPYNVPILVFCLGNWHGFEISETSMNYFKNNPVNTDIIEKPGLLEIQEPMGYAVCIDSGVRIRQSPIIGKIIGYAQKGTNVTVLENLYDIGKQDRWIKVKTGNIIGYSAAWYYLPCYCSEMLVNLSEDKNMSTFESILTFLRTFLTRPILAAILGPLVAIFLGYVPNFPFTDEQIINATIAIVLFIIGANTIWERENVRSGNIWDKRSKQFIKPYTPETTNTITNIIKE